MKKVILNVILFISILVMCFGHIYTISLEPYDELWNFQNIYKLYNGYSIYSDANIIITPIFYILGLCFFKLFGATMNVFRIYNICITISFFILLYQIFKSLKVSKHLNLLFLGLILTQFLSVINGGASYTMLCFTFVLLGMWSYINLSNKKYFNYLQGFIVFLVFFTKQNIGIYYALSILLFEFIYRKKLSSFIINQLKKGLTFTLSLLISFCILFKNNVFFDFWNYCFGGLLEFGSTNIVFSSSPSIVMMILITICLYIFIVLSKNKFDRNVFTDERIKNLHLIGIISICTILSVFPIANTAHFLYIFPFFAILLFYFLDFSLLEEILDTTRKNNYTYVLALLIFIFVSIKYFYSYSSEVNSLIQINDLNHPFYKTSLSKSNFEKMSTVTEYIKNKNQTKTNVIIISFDSALSMIPLNQNNGAFDLVFSGNLGYNGEDKLIEKIKGSKNTEFLILTNEKDCYWQEIPSIRSFITDNLEKKGEVSNYSIYKLPEN